MFYLYYIIQVIVREQGERKMSLHQREANEKEEEEKLKALTEVTTKS